MIYFCCDERRRNAVESHASLNGIDFLEVSDDRLDPVDVRQRILFVHFIKPLAAGALKVTNVRIDGGERVKNIKVVDVNGGSLASPPISSPPGIDTRVLVVRVVQRQLHFPVTTINLPVGQVD